MTLALDPCSDPHFDYFFHDDGINNGGNRLLTVLMYLSDVEEGGETVRTGLGLWVLTVMVS